VLARLDDLHLLLAEVRGVAVGDDLLVLVERQLDRLHDDELVADGHGVLGLGAFGALQEVDGDVLGDRVPPDVAVLPGGPSQPADSVDRLAAVRLDVIGGLLRRAPVALGHDGVVGHRRALALRGVGPVVERQVLQVEGLVGLTVLALEADVGEPGPQECGLDQRDALLDRGDRRAGVDSADADASDPAELGPAGLLRGHLLLLVFGPVVHPLDLPDPVGDLVEPVDRELHEDDLGVEKTDGHGGLCLDDALTLLCGALHDTTPFGCVGLRLVRLRC
jgi:hypothetical protein